MSEAKATVLMTGGPKIPGYAAELLDNWLPIETAPKDRKILGCTWVPGLPHLYAPTTIVWAAYHPNATGKECWRDSEICGNKLERVTHWQPLPKTPS